MEYVLGRLMLTIVVLRMAAFPFGAEEVALAQIIQGEAGHEFMYGRSAGAYCVGWVARNRVQSGLYGESYQDLDGFNGRLTGDPSWRYLAIARVVINYHGDDPTGGAMYVLSQQDVDRLGFDEGKATLVLRASKQRALLFFVEWPGGKE